MELFESNLAAFFEFGFVLAVFAAGTFFDFQRHSRAARLKLDFRAENPFFVEFVIKSQHKPRYRNLGVVDLRAALGAAPTVETVILPRRQHLAVTAQTEFIEGCIYLRGRVQCANRSR